MKTHVPEPAKMTLNQASRELDAKLLDAVNYSGLPLRLVELQLLNLLHAVQDKLAQEEAGESRQTGKESDVNG